MYQNKYSLLIKLIVISFIPSILCFGCHKNNEKKRIDKVFITYMKGTIDFPTSLKCDLLVKCDFMPTEDTIVTAREILDSLLIQINLLKLGNKSDCDSRLKAIIIYNAGKNDTLCFGEAFCGVMNEHSILNSDRISNMLKEAAGYYNYLPWENLRRNKIYLKYHSLKIPDKVSQ